MDTNARLARAKDLFIWLHFLYYGSPDGDPLQRDTLRIHFDKWTVPQRLELGTLLYACHGLHKAYQNAKNKRDTYLARIGGDLTANTDKELKALHDACREVERLAIAFKTNLEAIRRKHNALPRKNLFACDSIDKLYQQLNQEFKEVRDQKEEIAQIFVNKANEMAAAQAKAERAGNKFKFGEIRKDMETGKLDYEEPALSSYGNWVFATHLGRGGFGMASLWVKLDDDGIVRDRVVRKDAPMSKRRWMDPSNWIHVPENEAIRIPFEWYTQNLAQGFAAEPYPNVVRTRKYENDEEKMIYRLYTNFYPYGDLNNLMCQNKSLRTWFPESWVWMAFSQLVDAGLAMESGKILSRLGKQVVHRDLKPMNVFLDLENATSWPNYPQVAVGDFGLAILTSPDDPNNPNVYDSAGTRGYLAPEQELLSKKGLPSTLPKLLAHTNVWGIGKTMMDICNLPPYVRPEYAPDGACTSGSFKSDAKEQYSPMLLETIVACMAQPANKRPTFAQLRERIDTVMSTPPADSTSHTGKLLAYMSNARNGIQHHDSVFDLHGLPNEQYKVDMVFQNLRPEHLGPHPPVAAAAGATG